jgi:hypothetical protein
LFSGGFSAQHKGQQGSEKDSGKERAIKGHNQPSRVKIQNGLEDS